MGSTWGQPEVNLGSSRSQSGVSLQRPTSEDTSGMGIASVSLGVTVLYRRKLKLKPKLESTSWHFTFKRIDPGGFKLGS